MDRVHKNQYIERMLENYSSLIVRIAYQQVKNKADAEDIAQEVLIKLMTLAPDFESTEHEKAWIIRVTINQCKDFHKSAWNRKREYLDDTMPAPEQEETGEVLEAVLGLPAKYKNVIYLFYYEGYSILEIADILKQKETTVGSWLHRARKLLKKKLGEEVEYV